MRAVRMDRFGDTSVLEVRDVEDPVPAPDGVVVEVLASSINPGEAKIRSGSLAAGGDRFPMGEGSDLAGRIVAVGTGPGPWTVGDEVLGWTDDRAAHAEYVAVPSSQLVPKPAALGWEQAGSLYVAGGTAWALTLTLPAQAGDTVVVTAAAGGVGTFLVQLLAGAGVRVLGVAGAANDDAVRTLGAEPVHRGDGLADRLRAAAPDGIAAFYDLHGDGYTDLALELGVPADRVATIADFERAQVNGTRAVFGYTLVDAGVMAQLADLSATGRLQVPIAATYPLEQVRAAFDALADGHTRGKIVLLPHGSV